MCVEVFQIMVCCFKSFGIAHSLIVGLQYDLLVDVEREECYACAQLLETYFSGI